MKKRITVIAILVLLVVVGVFATGCFAKKFEAPNKIIGLEKPTSAPAKAIDKKMSGTDMLMAGIDNFYAADYVSTLLAGQVTVKIGTLPVTQSVFGTKIREGKATTEQEKKDAIYYVDNKSYSSVVQVYEETIVNQKAANADDRVKYVSYNKRKYDKKSDPDGFGVVGWGDPVKEKKKPAVSGKSFDSVASLVSDMKNDPTRIWMYTTTPETIANVSKVTTNSAGQYEFTVDLDINKATEDYRQVMLHMLNASVSCKDEDLKFRSVQFTVKMWENGFISELGIVESYDVKIAGIINSTITLESVQQYSYDMNEKGFDIASRLEASKSWPNNIK